MTVNEPVTRVETKPVFGGKLARLLLAALVVASFPVVARDSAATPTIMIIMQEKVAGVFGTTGFEQPNQAELTLMEKFNELEFKVVDPSMVKRNLDRAQGLRFLEGDDAAAAAHGLQHGAEISIIGSAISKPSGGKLFGTRMQTIQATLTARVIRNDDARVIATGSASATQAHIDEVQGGVMAIEKAADELAGELSSRILAVWSQKAATGSTDITVTINGLVSYRHLDFILYYFEKDVQGVESVDMRSFTASVADVGLVYQGRTDELARLIANKRFKGFRLEPTSVTANRLDLLVRLDKPRR